MAFADGCYWELQDEWQVDTIPPTSWRVAQLPGSIRSSFSCFSRACDGPLGQC